MWTALNEPILKFGKKLFSDSDVTAFGVLQPQVEWVKYLSERDRPGRTTDGHRLPPLSSHLALVPTGPSAVLSPRRLGCRLYWYCSAMARLFRCICMEYTAPRTDWPDGLICLPLSGLRLSIRAHWYSSMHNQRTIVSCIKTLVLLL